MTCLVGCSRCKTGWMRHGDIICPECSGENSRKSYKTRTTALNYCLIAAATEELRVRAATARLLSALTRAAERVDGPARALVTEIVKELKDGE